MREKRAAVPVRLAGAVGALALAAVPIASAQPTQVVSLPNPVTLVSPPPPIGQELFLPREVRLPNRISSEERVLVGLAQTGAPVSVRVVQTLVLTGVGDYTFSIPAPVVDVRPGPRTESQPGERTNQILWQGFAPGRRVLSAVADLRRGATVRALPLRVAVAAAGDRLTLTILNATTISVDTFTADAVRPEAVRALEDLDDAVRSGLPAPASEVRVRGPVVPRTTLAAAPMRVQGELRLPPESVRGARVIGAGKLDEQRGRVRFTAVLGGRPSPALKIVLAGLTRMGGEPRIRIAATPVDPPVPPPRPGLNGRDLLEQTIDLSISYELARRYRMFLLNPDPAGSRSARYVFRTSAGTPTTVTGEPSSGRALGPVALLGVIAGSVLVACAAVVAWAHS